MREYSYIYIYIYIYIDVYAYEGSCVSVHVFTCTLSVVYGLLQIICVNYPASLLIRSQYALFFDECDTQLTC